MRLFLLAVLCGSVLAGCKKDDSKAGALNVTIGYSGFKRACLTVTATDDAQNTNSTTVEISEVTGNPVSVAVFREKDWGRVLNVTAQVHELNCSGPVVASDDMKGEVPKEGKLDLGLTVSALDKDDDGYFSTAFNGSDCDDDKRAVNPAATEVCNGWDDNCRDGENDAQVKPTWYVDQDGDSYVGTAVQSCAAPPNSGPVAMDCDDTNALINPGASESRCDGKDDNCNQQVDEGFDVGGFCEDGFSCSGKKACDTNPALTKCVVTEAPEQWYVDRDGDGAKGESVGPYCGVPPTASTAINVQQDCDEDSRFVSKLQVEVCDRLDNNCDGQVDEGCTLPLPAWSKSTVTPSAEPNFEWKAIAIFGSTDAWFGGRNPSPSMGGAVFLTDGSTANPAANCDLPVSAAWAGTNRRLILATETGSLATRLPGDTGCYGPPEFFNFGAFNGITGLGGDLGQDTTAYAVTSTGKIVKWSPPFDTPATVSLAGDVGSINLRAISSRNSLETMLAVGVRGDGFPVAFSYRTGSGTFEQETLPSSTAVFIYGVHVLSDRIAYAAGQGGKVFERQSGVWRELPTVTNPDGGAPTDVLDVIAFSTKSVYVVTTSGEIAFYDGLSWTTVYNGDDKLNSIDGLDSRRLGAVGQKGAVVYWPPP
ncbi:putative metal-binding motif-containing protein [Corallococcus sp. bb12-1]|uniref:putative metal-binding motif-containing protein n=1 Tax=Corallococcus sp. bb12-1 TaxID=2996784 RepID=UPI00226E0B6D|nr:putative metal-binding motif-containing protein [Corallococcus sp. bb12-1]MCY1041540.1 putative metal-binding motif-containing protein [Corallococcus sp. bb12-1]